LKKAKDGWKKGLFVVILLFNKQKENQVVLLLAYFRDVSLKYSSHLGVDKIFRSPLLNLKLS
jgi:hypothetical protein